jgi:hypothetical protein
MANKKTGTAMETTAAAGAPVFMIDDDVFAIGNPGEWASKVVIRNRGTGGRPSLTEGRRRKIPAGLEAVSANPTIRRRLGV